MEREAWVLQQWLALCTDLGIDAAFAEEWGEKIVDGYRYIMYDSAFLSFLGGRRQKAVYRHHSAPPYGTSKYTYVFDPDPRR